ncbi:trypsin-like peptidase domain-containing protein [Myxococcota bacterium]
MRRVVLFLPALFFSCSKTPEEAASLFVVQVSNGFDTAAGVTIAEGHIVTSSKLLAGMDVAEVLVSQAEKVEGLVVERDDRLGIALVQIQGAPDRPSIGASGELLKSDPLVTRTFLAAGQATIGSGKLVGWSYAEGLAYMETNLAAQSGAGFFDAYGKLVAVQAFRIEPQRTFLLPIEYITNGPRALTRTLLDERDDDEAFSATRAEANKHPDRIPIQLEYEEITNSHAFSKTALVGALTLLDSKEDPAHAKPVAFEIEAAAQAGPKVVASGTIDQVNVSWASQPDSFTRIKSEQLDNFGDIWVEDNLAPRDYGELRYRLPLASFCSKVSSSTVYALQLTLADGRTPGRLVLADLSNGCSGSGGDGDGLENAWFSSPVATPTMTPSKKTSKAKHKRKKGKRKGKRKRRKRR